MEKTICSRCIMDTTDPEITFDENGQCNHCTRSLALLRSEPYCLSPADKSVRLDDLVAKIKAQGKKLRYDCVIGVSGGVDSSYVAYKVVELGLRPLAIHLDNGWNSELSVKNIENVCTKLHIDLYTHVVNWDEFKDLQLSFLKSSTPDSEIPTDHAIVSLLYQKAKEEKTRFILAGTNIASESVLPPRWSQGHEDWRYIRNVQRLFGSKRLKTFPHRNRVQDFYYRRVAKLQWINFLDYVEYRKEDAKKFLQKELSWQDYGGKHYESNYTKIFQAYILPVKFGYDKRKAHYSSLICSGQMTREEALKEMKVPLYDPEHLEQDIRYIVNKFGITRTEFESIMKSTPKAYADYPNSLNAWYAPALNLVGRTLRKVLA